MIEHLISAAFAAGLAVWAYRNYFEARAGQKGGQQKKEGAYCTHCGNRRKKWRNPNQNTTT